MRAITDLKTHAQASSSLRRTRPTVNVELKRLIWKAFLSLHAQFLIEQPYVFKAVLALQARPIPRTRGVWGKPSAQRLERRTISRVREEAPVERTEVYDRCDLLRTGPMGGTVIYG